MAAIITINATTPIITIFFVSFKNDLSVLVVVVFFIVFVVIPFFSAVFVALVTFFSVISFFFLMAILSP
ncbi:MAG TPA: hypothetical protein PLU96_05515 [Methanofastidiosum sp.]|nr:hypothetical protein [Methanofastidiosum sp.]HQF89901.1 hypothetical protein [Methanofastidiosum sp.]HQG61520.1 hypothetical protein [Methanofastidiosum sp.]HQK85605.1 hypothetical protein [Methanofastidiosum sp.]